MCTGCINVTTSYKSAKAIAPTPLLSIDSITLVTEAAHCVKILCHFWPFFEFFEYDFGRTIIVKLNTGTSKNLFEEKEEQTA